MKKLLIMTTLMLVLFGMSLSLQATVTDYTFGSSTGTYTEITGGTTLTGASVDDGLSAATDIGFSFVYDGVVYTQFKSCTNGFVTLGTANTSNAWTNVINSTTVRPALAAFWDDLGTSATGTVSYVLTGTGTTRVLTVQFKDIAWYVGTTNLINFQIKLYETTNKVEFVYGTMGNVPGGSESVSIGINDAASNYISVTPASPPTYSSTVPNNTVGTAHVAFLTSGMIYTFTPNALLASDVGVFSVDVTTPQPINATIAPKATVRNYGLNPKTFTVNMSITPGGYTSTQTVTLLASLTSQQVTFSDWVPTTAGTHTITVTTTLFGDGNAANNTQIANINIIAPLEIPFTQDFSSTTFPPEGWTLAATPWVLGTPNGYGAPGTGSAKANFYSISSGTLDMISPLFNIGTSNATLSFNHAYATYSGENDQLEILASTDGGSTYTSLIIYDGGSAGPLNTGGTLTGTFIPTAEQWATKSIPLPAGTNKVKFHGISAYGNDLYVDNITVSNALAHDVAVVSINNIPTLQPVGSAISPKATVINNGTSTETFNVQMTITPGTYSSIQRATSLATGGTTQLTFANWTPTAPGDYTVTVTTQLVGDLLATNNELTTTLSVAAGYPVGGSAWTAGAAIPAPNYAGSGVGYVAADGTGYVLSVGGSGSLGTEVLAYNIHANTWISLPNLPVSNLFHATAIVGDQLFVIGGSNSVDSYYNTVYRSTVMGTWETVAPLPITLAWCKAVTYGQYIYVAGGIDAFTSGNYRADVFVYNTVTDVWSSATSLPSAVFGGALAITGNTLVYVAGVNDLGELTSTVYVGTISLTDPTVIDWNVAPTRFPGASSLTQSTTNTPPSAMTLEQSLLSKTQNNNRFADYPVGGIYRIDGDTWGTEGIIIAGGSQGGAWSSTSNFVFVYKPATDSWYMMPSLLTSITYPAMATVKTSPTEWSLVVAAGYNGTGISSGTQVISVASQLSPVVTITNVDATTIRLDWASVAGANSYTVYSTDNPNASWELGEWGASIIAPTANNYVASIPVGTATKKFYKVVASPLAP